MNKSDKLFPQRKSPRLEGYDYSLNGAYFVTICTHNRTHYFGKIVEANVQLSVLGQVAYNELARLHQHWDNVDIDLFVVMPNHIHAIIIISDNLTNNIQTDTQKRVPTLGHIVGNYKSGVTRIAYQQGFLTAGQPLWQKRYHDHIIRHENTLNDIRQYVQHNPTSWEKDVLYS